MAVRPILKLGHPKLSRKSDPIVKITPEVAALAKDLIQTMHAAPGIGLSAPQVGENVRLITVDLSMGERQEELVVLINPEISRPEGSVVREEGCLSVPEIYEKVTRPQRVTVKGLDLEGQERVLEAEDLLARVFCHEVDHLDGRLFVDFLSPLKRSLIKRKFRKESTPGRN
ncbi:MAG: peptide deformylase [Candidatus Aminicenantes bacterium]|nr:peptide deformylase [Candidatus Aminicenantes bacterium]